MKSISSSIVVAAGIYGIVSTTPLLNHSTYLFSLVGLAAGVITLALGLVGWWACLKFDR